MKRFRFSDIIGHNYRSIHKEDNFIYNRFKDIFFTRLIYINNLKFVEINTQRFRYTYPWNSQSFSIPLLIYIIISFCCINLMFIHFLHFNLHDTTIPTHILAAINSKIHFVQFVYFYRIARQICHMATVKRCNVWTIKAKCWARNGCNKPGFHSCNKTISQTDLTHSLNAFLILFFQWNGTGCGRNAP